MSAPKEFWLNRTTVEMQSYPKENPRCADTRYYPQDEVDQLKAERDEYREKCLRLTEALEKSLKEYLSRFEFKKCEGKEHDWEPDTSMTIMRCDRCGVGASNWSAKQTLEKYGVKE